MRIEIKDFEEGLVKRISPEDLPKNALAKVYDFSVYSLLGLAQTRKGREKAFDVTFPGVIDVKYANLFSSNKVFSKADDILYRGIRPIKQNLSSNRMDFTEFADWLLMCDGTSNLKYKESMTLSWLVSCCFDFEEAGIPSGWTTHQSAITLRISHNAQYACTYEWERAEIDGDVSSGTDTVFYTTAVDLGMSIQSGSPPNADMLLHLDTTLVDTMSNHSPSAVGNAAISTIEKKFGAGALRLDGTGDYVTVADSDNWNFASSALTVDFWFFVDSGSTNEEHCLISQVTTSGGFALWYSDQTDKFHFWGVNGTEAIGKTFTYVLTKSQWYHVALIRGWGSLADQWAICINGVAQVTWINDITMPDLAASLRIGNIDAAYNGTLEDHAVDANNVAYNDNAGFTTSKAKWGNGCISLESDASQDPNLSIGTNTNITIDEDFTLDFWCYLTNGGSNLTQCSVFKSVDTGGEYEQLYLTVNDDAEVSVQAIVYADSAVKMNELLNGGDQGTVTDAWHHFAIIRVGNDWGLYLDGDQIAYATADPEARADVDTGFEFFKADVVNERYIYTDEFRFTSANEFDASPNVGNSDTITVPSGRHDINSATHLLLRPTTMDSDIYLDELRWKKGLARWIENFDVPTGADAGIGTTISSTGALGGDMAVPLGMDAPASAVTAATGAAGALTGDYYYKVTYGNNDSFESNPSPTSALVQPSSDKVELTAIPQSNNPQVTERHIYRTEAGGLVFRYLTTLEDNYTVAYSDNAADSTLGAVAETIHNAPVALQAIHSHSSRVFGIASGYPNKLVWCNGWDEWEYFDTNNFEPFGSASDDTKRLFTIGKILVLVQESDAWTFDTRGYPEYNWVKSEGSTIRGIPSVAAASKIGPVILCVDAEGGYLFDGQQVQNITQVVDPIFDFDGSDSDMLDESRIENLAVGHFKDYLLISYSTGSVGALGGINDRTIVYHKKAQKIEQIIRMGFSSFSTNLEDKICYAAGYDGYIYKLFSSTQDAGSDIAWQIETKDFNGDIGPELMLKEASYCWLDCNPNGNSITVNIYMDNLVAGAQIITGSSRKVVAFRLPDQQFYRVSFNLVGSGVQQIYRMAFEADPIGGQSEIQG